MYEQFTLGSLLLNLPTLSFVPKFKFFLPLRTPVFKCLLGADLLESRFPFPLVDRTDYFLTLLVEQLVLQTCQ